MLLSLRVEPSWKHFWFVQRNRNREKCWARKKYILFVQSARRLNGLTDQQPYLRWTTWPNITYSIASWREKSTASANRMQPVAHLLHLSLLVKMLSSSRTLAMRKALQHFGDSIAWAYYVIPNIFPSTLICYPNRVRISSKRSIDFRIVILLILII